MQLIDVKSVRADDNSKTLDIEYVVPRNGLHNPEIRRRIFNYDDLAQRLWAYNEPVVIVTGGEEKLWIPKEKVEVIE